MGEATYYKCAGCGYEFLSKTKDPVCPRCKSRKLETEDIGALAGIDE